MDQATMNPMGLTVEEAARLLSLPVDKVREHLAQGLPTGPDGRINLVQYAAWLNRQLVEDDGD